MRYYVTNKDKNKFNKILMRIKQIDTRVYDLYKCHPTKILTIQESDNILVIGQRVILFDGEEVSPVMKLLGFSFDGLYDDWERRVKEIENFGKYCCEIYTNQEIDINKYKYLEQDWEVV